MGRHSYVVFASADVVVEPEDDLFRPPTTWEDAPTPGWARKNALCTSGDTFFRHAHDMGRHSHVVVGSNDELFRDSYVLVEPENVVGALASIE